MRIARVLTRLNLGGPARQVSASDPLLRERGHELRLFAGTPGPGEGDLFDELEAAGLDLVRVPGLARGVNPLGDWRAERALVRELSAFAPDLVHTHASKAGWVGRRALRRVRGPRSVHTFHGHVLEGYFPEPVSRLLVRRERELARETDRIVAVSHRTADDLVRLGVTEEERLVVVPPGIRLERFLELPRPRATSGPVGPLRELCGVDHDAFLVGCVARLAPVKRPRLAIEVVELLAERHPQLHLVFVGDGPERRGLERRIEGLEGPLAGRVHLVGARTDMPPVFAELDAVLLTSHSEGLPIALIEAAASALPVVSTDVGGVSEIVIHERTGTLGTTVDELAFGLDALVTDPAERLAMGQRARMRVAHRHSAENLADRLEALYAAVLEEAPCAS